jgi:hypothetical protein
MKLDRRFLASANAILMLSWLAPVSLVRAADEPKHTKIVAIEGKNWEADQVDYPIQIVCHKGAGKDDAKDVFLGDNVRDDFGDVRFSDGKQPLDYWLESSTPGKEAVFWVKVPNIPRNGRSALNVHFGHPDLKTTSNGKKVFRFFDDFPGNYSGLNNENVPSGWVNTLKSQNEYQRWIVSGGIIQFKGSGHLTTKNKVWPNPAKETYTLRFRAMWPDPAFRNAVENALSIGGTSLETTDGNCYMDIVGMYQPLHGQKTVASFGICAGTDPIKNFDTNKDLKPFSKSFKGSYLTYEIERKPQETLTRIIEAREELRSDNVIKDDMYLMIHGCHFDQPDSPSISLNFMLLRKQAYPNPSYGEWK